MLILIRGVKALLRPREVRMRKIVRTLFIQMYLQSTSIWQSDYSECFTDSVRTSYTHKSFRWSHRWKQTKYWCFMGYTGGMDLQSSKWMCQLGKYIKLCSGGKKPQNICTIWSMLQRGLVKLFTIHYSIHHCTDNIIRNDKMDNMLSTVYWRTETSSSQWNKN